MLHPEYVPVSSVLTALIPWQPTTGAKSTQDSILVYVVPSRRVIGDMWGYSHVSHIFSPLVITRSPKPDIAPPPSPTAATPCPDDAGDTSRRASSSSSPAARRRGIHPSAHHDVPGQLNRRDGLPGVPERSGLSRLCRQRGAAGRASTAVLKVYVRAEDADGLVEGVQVYEVLADQVVVVLCLASDLGALAEQGGYRVGGFRHVIQPGNAVANGLCRNRCRDGTRRECRAL